MSRKSRSGRRTAQARPRPGQPLRQPSAPASAGSIEERLAELERERERLLAAAAHPATEDGEAEDGEAEADASEDENAPAGEEKQAAVRRPQTQRAPAARPSVPTAAQRSAPSRPAVGLQSGARRVGRVTPGGTAVAAPARVPQRGVAARAADTLDPVDPSIPLAQVPYVRSDLRRVAMIAGIMVALIIIADIIVSHVVK